MTPIPGFTGYFATDDGKIVSKRHRCNRELKPDVRKIDGRKRYTLRSDCGRFVRKYGSHWVLMAFVGPRPEGMEACHGNGNCTDDSAGNLRWDTSIANKSDMRLHGTLRRGSQISTFKLTDSAVSDILLMRQGNASVRDIASKHGVTQTRVYQILKKGGR